jgi:Bacteriophage related domain of unknown function
MPIETDIAAALFARLKTLALTPPHPIAWPNLAFNPPDDGRWLRATMMPVSVDAFSINETNEHRGMLQVDVFAPLDSGLTTATTIAGLVRQHFRRGDLLRSGDAAVEILRAYPGPDIRANNRLMIPVTINWRCFAPN